MKKPHTKQFPNESASYRKKRNVLLEAEVKLRHQLEQVAALRRTLPRGGRIPQDYVFEEMSTRSKIATTRFSKLFEPGKNTLIVYNFMFPNHEGKPCPACTSILDGLNGSALHIQDKVNFVIVAKAPIKDLQSWTKKRRWNNLRLVSSAKNEYNKDYFAEDTKGNQLPILNIFQKTPKGIFHFHGSELFFVSPEKRQDARHVDLIWPIWQMFDLTPEGRGIWHPKYTYKKAGKHILRFKKQSVD